VFEFNVTTWGWIHIILGVILVLSGVGIFSGNVLGRIVGVIVAALAMIVNFAWLPYYAVWSIIVIVIAICIGIVWASPPTATTSRFAEPATSGESSPPGQTPAHSTSRGRVPDRHGPPVM